MRLRECKAGVKVRVHKPADSEEHPGWLWNMDRFLKGVFTLAGPIEGEEDIVALEEDRSGWAFSPRWLTRA
jgi:hypothetical protein